MIIGVDIGTRRVHMVGLEGDTVIASSVEVAKGNRAEELADIHNWVRDHTLSSDHVFVEEPPYVNNRRTFLGLGQTCGAILAAITGSGYLVEVSTWKGSVVGHGGIGKDGVKAWLGDHHPELLEATGGVQDFVDAACIALYGRSVLQIAGIHGVGAGDHDRPDPQELMEARERSIRHQ